MVKKAVFSFCAFFCFAPLFFACKVLYYNDYDSRFDWHDEFHFLEPAELSPVLGEEYSFIVVSDTHISSPQKAAFFKKIQGKLIPEDEFIVVTGDITGRGSPEELELFIAAARSIGIPCYPVIGNHDLTTDRAAPWKRLIGSTVYRVNAPGTSLFILDNANASFGYDQLSWLEAQLRSAEKNTFVFFHENLFLEYNPLDYDQTTDIRERARLMSMLKGRCHIVFMGHRHKQILKEFSGTQYIVMEDYSGSGEKGIFCRVRVSYGAVSREFEKVE